MTNLTNMTNLTISGKIAAALDETASVQTNTTLRGSNNDHVVIANADGVEIHYFVRHKTWKKMDDASGYAITREDGKCVGVHSLRGLPKSRAAAAREIAWDARNEVARIRYERSQIAKNIRAFFDRKSD